MTDTLDDFAFAAACDAAPGTDPEAIRAAVNAYLAELHLTVNRIVEGRALTADEAEDAFRPRESSD